MSVFDCCGSSFRTLSRAAAKAASARLRQMGIGGVSPDWSRRASICERCPMRVVQRGISYCGKPLLQQIDRDQSEEGCGCPTHAKARIPDEHCPITMHHAPARVVDGRCNCRWCASR